MNIIKKFPFPSFGTLVFCCWKTIDLIQIGIQKVYLKKLVNFFLLNLVISMIIIMTEKNLVTWMSMIQNVPNEHLRGKFFYCFVNIFSLWVLAECLYVNDVGVVKATWRALVIHQHQRVTLIRNYQKIFVKYILFWFIFS